MWIYVPETYCQSAPASEDWISRLTWQAKMLEQFVMWREKPSLSRHWLKRWKQGGWIKRLFGRIYEPSTARLGVESWIRSLAESRASLIPSPDFSAERTTSETSGPTPQVSSPISSPVESSWKTFQASLHITLNESGQTYEQWVTQQRRDYFRRVRSAQAINGSDSSYWPTARAREPGSTREDYGDGLGELARMWPAATANRGTYSGEGYGSNLIEESKMWPTITVEDAGRTGSQEGWEKWTSEKQTSQYRLRNAIHAEASASSLQSPSSRRSETTPPDGPVCSPKCRKLNPLFVELHMGVPMGFSSMKTESIDSDRWETWLSLSRERLRLLISHTRPDCMMGVNDED